MTTRETTTTSTLGWPKAGELVSDGRTASIPIDFGGGEIIAVTDPAWARQLASVAAIAANALESVLGIDLLELEPEREIGADETAVLPVDRTVWRAS